MTLNEVINVYRKEKGQTRAADGTLSSTRTHIAKLYAMIRPMSGSERARSDNTEAFATHRFHVHYRDDIQASDIIVWNTQDYNIKFISYPSEQEKYMYIDAERGGAM